MFQQIDTNKDGVVTIDELVEWCSRDEQILQSLETLDTVLWSKSNDSYYSIDTVTIRVLNTLPMMDCGTNITGILSVLFNG